jgi:hypothetical protein
MRSRAALALVCAAVLGPGPAFAAETIRTETLRWIQPDGPRPDGVLFLIGEAPRAYNQAIAVSVPQVLDSIATSSLALPAGRDLYVAMVAYNTAGFSAPSNEIFFAATAVPVPPVRPPEDQALIALGHGQPGTRTPLVTLAGELFEGPEIDGSVAGQHVAWCDLAGDGTPELVVGQDGSGSGQLVVVDVEVGAVRALLGGSGSRAARPACGDLDGDGRDEIVAGLDATSGAWIQVFDDWNSFLMPLRLSGLDGFGRLPRRGWRSRLGTGAVQPAVGDLDGDGRDEIVLALDRDGGGWVRVLDDALLGLAPLSLGPIDDGWLRASIADEAVFPALGDGDGDGRDELVFGYATPGQLRILDDPVARSEGTILDGWFELPEASAAGASLHPALGDLDQDGQAELVLGFDGALGSWLRVFTDPISAPQPHPSVPDEGWIDVSEHGVLAPVFPAVRPAP